MCVVRTAALEDLSEILKIEEQFKQEAFSANSLKYLIKSNNIFKVITVKKAVVGYYILLFNKRHKSCRLYSIAVSKDYQGKGYSYKLLDDVESVALNKNRTSIKLEVSNKNKVAYNLYTKLKYDLIEIVHEYYHDGSSALKMKKNI